MTTNSELLALAREVTPLLGAGWAVDESSEQHAHAAYIDGQDGARLRIARDYSTPRGKITAGGCMPQGTYDVLRYDERARHDINVGESRGAEVMAREITRRLLPAYLEQLADVNERLNRQSLAAANRAAAIDKLAREFKGSVAPNGHRPDEARFGHASRDYYGSVSIRHHADAVDLEIHGLPIELASRIAAVLAEADKDECGRHGGKWGGDETCEDCTNDDGTIKARE